ncbi:hypothetical protein INT46_011649 [Mucor plumbeus]|uniref:4-nitrophenylphosphatase n=1 Tax=Mucor plumbeus TaxID=97098 RepID=A0A8H7QGC6_9FUNG|nr:hypothetical protein INT46_011649 [Mucor plumbeus]
MLDYLKTKAERDAFIDQYDNFLFDCDGVLWEGTHMFDGVPEAMELLRSKGKRVFFVTNNSTKSRESFLQKFKGFNVKATKEEVFSSAFATASYLKHVLKFPEDKKVYVIGMAGIKDELAAEGIRSCGGEDDSGLTDNDAIPEDKEVGAVVIGLDTQVNYKKYAKAFSYLSKNEGCHFIVTNEDSTYPQHGAFYPGAGSIAAPIITALGRRPDAVLGKPAQNMLEAIYAEYGLDPKKTVMIGDRLNTDIEFGLNGGLDTLCVLTGITSKEELLSPSNKPTQEQLDGNSTVSSINLGDLLRGLGQNPTQAEVAELVKETARSKSVPETQEFDIDFGTFLSILTRPDGFKPAGSSQEFIQGFQVFDKEGDGYISAGELRYVLTNLGEKLDENEVDELLKDVEVGKDGRINYVANENACFYIWADKPGKKLGFYFAVQQGGSFDIDYDVKGPNGVSILNGEHERQGDFVFTANAYGEYSFCFSNDMSTFAEKLIDFEITVENEVRPNFQKDASGKEQPAKLTEMEESLFRLSGSLTNIARTQKYFRTRENRNSATVISTEGRIFWFAFMESLAIISMACLQVFVVKNFFNVKKGGV